MITVVIILLGILLAISVFVNFNLLNQVQQLETTITENKVEEDVVWIYSFILKLLVKAKADLDKVDRRGTFSSDDEVGFAFKIIQQTIDMTVDKLQQMNITDEKTKNK